MPASLRRWSPALACLFVLLLGVALASGFQRRIDEQTAGRALQAAGSLAASFETAFRTRTRAVGGLAARWGEDGIDERRFRRDVARLVDDLRGYAAIAFIAVDGAPRWIEPPGAVPAIGNLAQPAVVRMRATGAPAIGRSPQGEGGGASSFFVAFPLETEGYVVAAFDVATFVRETMVRFGGADGYAIAIYDGDAPIFTSLPAGVRAEALRWSGHRADLLGASWRIEVAPLQATIEADRSALPELSVGAALAIGLLVAATMRKTQAARDRAAEAESARRSLEAEMVERERVAAALHRSEELYRTLAAHVPDAAVVLFDRELRFLLGEGPLLHRLGIARQPLEGAAIVEILPETVAARLLPLYTATLDGASQEVEVPWRRRWFQVRTAPVRGDDGVVYAGMALAHEITGRKRAEEELRATALRLERSNRELQDFAYIASHDLQEPLRKVQAFGERLARRYGEALDEQGRDYLGRMTNAAGRMSALLEGLLDFSRVTTNAKPFERCDLAEIARQVVSDLEVRIEETRATVEIEALPSIDADPLQMRQLLQNLLANALKFHEPGKAPHVRVAARLEEELCVLEVADDGIGFDEKYLDRIFAVFQRLHGRGVYEGSGVGLAICRKIAQRHGGDVGARSAPGRGATFVVRLPARQPGGEAGADAA